MLGVPPRGSTSRLTRAVRAVMRSSWVEGSVLVFLALDGSIGARRPATSCSIDHERKLDQARYIAQLEEAHDIGSDTSFREPRRRRSVWA